MTASIPSPRLSPTAGLFNALVRHLNGRLTTRITELRTLIAVETERGHALRTTASFEDSDRSGYINRSFLEAS